MKKEDAIHILTAMKKSYMALGIPDPEAVEALEMAINAVKAEPCKDAISRQAAIDEIRFGQSYVTKISPTGAIEHLFDKENKALEEAVERIEELPPVNPQTKIGRWIPVGYDGYADGNPVIDEWECSNCGDEHYGDEQTLTAFCPCCGYEMTEERK